MVWSAMNGDTHNGKHDENPVIFLDIKFGAAKAGRVVIELFKDRVPKTAENFRALCTGEKGASMQGTPLHYKNTKFHRVVPIFLVQGGDVTRGDGTGGESIYGGKFEDENFLVLHDREGIVGMANDGPNTNGSQFYITTVPCSHLDGRNVAFGEVRKGLNIIIEMNDIPRENDKPLEVLWRSKNGKMLIQSFQPIVIEDCGEIALGDAWMIEEKDETDDKYPPWPNDWDVNYNEKIIENAIQKIKDSGNFYFKKKNYIDSERKYKKALRYIDWYLGMKRIQHRQLIDELRLNSLLNLAAVRLKRQRYKEVVDLCSEVLSKDPNNAKAFYRRALARLEMKDYDKAITDLNSAAAIEPKDNNIQAVLSTAKKKKLAYLKGEKKLYGNLFK